MIDLVYTWVNGDDPEVQRLRAAHQPGARLVDSEWQAGAARVRDNGELRYSLRSVDAYLPWIRRIYLVISGRPPEWLVPDERLVVVPDHAIIPEAHFPLFNSDGIESFLWRLDGLSERYLYSNDDYHFLRPHAPADFFDDRGRALVALTRSPLGRPIAGAAAGQYVQMELNATRALRRHLPPHALLDRVPAPIMRAFGDLRFLRVTHVQHPFRIAAWEAFEHDFAQELAELRRLRFRDAAGFTVNTAVHHFAAARGLARLRSGRGHVYVDRSLPLDRRDRCLRAIASGAVSRLCLNDVVGEPGDGWEAFRDGILARLLPKASRWEQPLPLPAAARSGT